MGKGKDATELINAAQEMANLDVNNSTRQRLTAVQGRLRIAIKEYGLQVVEEPPLPKDPDGNERPSVLKPEELKRREAEAKEREAEAKKAEKEKPADDEEAKE